MQSRVRVVGIGNVLMSDDGVGPYVVHHLLSHYDFPDEVSVIDGGTPGFDLLPMLHGADAIVLIDSVKAEGATPGEVRQYRKDELLRHPPQARVSPHDPALKQALLTLDFAGGGAPSVLLVGVVPEWVATGPHLSPRVRAAVSRAADAVVIELARLEAAPRVRRMAAPMDIWWERESVGVG
jgi:hydrogenase maturation protease